MTHKSEIMRAASTLFCNHLPKKRTALMYNIDAFGMGNTLKFTQNTVVIIPYVLTHSQQCCFVLSLFCAITHENLTRWNYWRERNRRVAKKSQRFIDSSINEWCHGLEGVV